MVESGTVEIRPVTAARLGDLADLFDSNGTTRGCWCMYHVVGSREFRAGYGVGNREAFERLTVDSDTPVGVLAYTDGVPVGWCAVGPRSRYGRAAGPRARILAGRDPAEDDDVWLAPCFFIRAGHRHRGLTTRLLEAAIEVADANGATAVEGFPRAAGQPRSADDYLGREELFTTCGFECIARPTPKRAVMRLGLR